MEAPDFWDDAEVSQKKMKELKDMKDDMETYQNLVTQMEDMETMIEMGYEENDPALIPEIQEMLDEFQKDFDNIRIKTLLSGEYDSENAIIKLNAGAGGTEACDWCGMLYRMYSRWADKKGFTLEVLDYLDGDEAGIKSVTFQVNGTNAYGYLKSEKGVHRLVRISPFNSAGKRQTSFASCDVLPDLEDDIDIEKIDISLDDTSMVIRVKLPDVHITDIIVDISSMDFIFYNKKADTATISSTAYRACEDDVKNESENQVEILELAHQNAVNIITALISPIIEQMDIGYTLHVE